MLVPHELPALGTDMLLHLLETLTEALEDSSHVTTLLHGDDTGVVLLIDPDEEVLLIVMPV